MTDEEFKELKARFNKAATIKYSIEETQKELNNLKKINDEKLKDIFFHRVFNGYVVDDQEWFFQKIICERILHFAIYHREKKIEKLQRQLREL